eukprot:403344296
MIQCFVTINSLHIELMYKGNLQVCLYSHNYEQQIMLRTIGDNQTRETSK